MKNSDLKFALGLSYSTRQILVSRLSVPVRVKQLPNVRMDFQELNWRGCKVELIELEQTMLDGYEEVVHVRCVWGEE